MKTWLNFVGVCIAVVVASDVAVAGRSCAQAFKLTLKGKGLTSQGYHMSERTYKLTREDIASDSSLELELLASEESPVFNPAFLTKKWGQGGCFA